MYSNCWALLHIKNRVMRNMATSRSSNSIDIESLQSAEDATSLVATQPGPVDDRVQLAQEELEYLSPEDELWHQFQVLEKQGMIEYYLADMLAEANELCAWPLTLQMFLGTSCSLDSECMYHASMAAWAMGYQQDAKDLITTVMIAEPENQEAFSLYGQQEDWRRFCEESPFGIERPTDGNGLSLQLLGHQHQSSFISIYDEEIADLCCLPNFMDSDHWHHWLDEQYMEGDQLTLAVMHADCGMIGVVSLILCDQVGFFYYWVGARYRGHGLGPAAVKLMLSGAQSLWGMHTCYAKAYKHNNYSHRGLVKLGFEELDIEAAAPHDNERFYRLGVPANPDQITDEMYAYYDRIRCEKAFTRPLVSSKIPRSSPPSTSGPAFKRPV